MISLKTNIHECVTEIMSNSLLWKKNSNLVELISQEGYYVTIFLSLLPRIYFCFQVDTL